MDEIELTNLRVVAIDGGTATGKGRLIEELAGLMRSKGVPVIHLSTGSLYRAVAYSALQLLLPKQGAEAMADLRQMKPAKMLAAAQKRQVAMHGGLVWIDGAEASVEQQLKGPGAGTGASIVASHREVREFVNVLTRRQINEFDGFIMTDGRDTTHVVVPDAPLKLLLTVAPEVAAQRSTEHTIDEIVARDVADRVHKYGALKHPDDPGVGVIVLATDTHTPESVRDHVYKMMRQVWGGLPEL